MKGKLIHNLLPTPEGVIVPRELLYPSKTYPDGFRRKPLSPRKRKKMLKWICRKIQYPFSSVQVSNNMDGYFIPNPDDVNPANAIEF